MKIYSVLFFLLFTFFGRSQIVIPYPDNSLAVSQYMELGLPSPKETWHAAEYKRVMKVLTGFYQVDKLSLPRKYSPYSATIFRQFNNLDNFQIILDNNLSIAQRIDEHQVLNSSVINLLNCYYEEGTEQRFGAEVMDLLITSAYVSEYSYLLMVDLQAFMSEKGVRNERVDEVYQNAKMGIGYTLKNYLELIEKDYSAYSEKDLIRFTSRLNVWVKEVKKYIEPAECQEIALKIQGFYKKQPSKSVRKNLRKMRRILKK